MDLDDMELKATREANGANRHKGNMEEDIEILQNFINEDWNCKYTLTKVKQSMKNILAELEKKDKVIEDIKEEVRDHIGFENRLKRDNREPDMFNQGRFYVANQINDILKRKGR